MTLADRSFEVKLAKSKCMEIFWLLCDKIHIPNFMTSFDSVYEAISASLATTVTVSNVYTGPVVGFMTQRNSLCDHDTSAS